MKSILSTKSKEEKHLKSFLQSLLSVPGSEANNKMNWTSIKTNFEMFCCSCTQITFWQEVKQFNDRMSQTLNEVRLCIIRNGAHVLTFLFSPADRVLACFFKWSFSSRAFTTLTTSKQPSATFIAIICYCQMYSIWILMPAESDGSLCL